MPAAEEFFAGRQARNALHSVVLLGGMFGLFGLFGWALGGGWSGMLLLGAVGLLSAGLGARMSPRLVLRMYGAHPLHRHEAPGLYRILDDLAARAGLPAVPVAHYVPTRMINAFAVGSPGAAAIGISDGLLRTLDPAEVRGVLAHEITHVRNNDAWVMGLADWVTRIVNLFAWVGQVMILVTLPAVLMGLRTPLPFGLLVLMIFAPTLSAQRVQGGFLERIFMPGRRVPEPSLLRTHPPTAERVRRLLEAEASLARAGTRIPVMSLLEGLPAPPPGAPRWHYLRGGWY